MLIDCNKENGGCNGGWPTDAFNYVKKNGISDAAYLYVNAEAQCAMKKHKKGLVNNVIQKIVEENLDGDEEKMKRIVNAKGPVVVAIHISNDLLAYGGGVYIDDLCSKTEVNHAVVSLSDSVKLFCYSIQTCFRSFAVMELILFTDHFGSSETHG